MCFETPAQTHAQHLPIGQVFGQVFLNTCPNTCPMGRCWAGVFNDKKTTPAQHLPNGHVFGHVFAGVVWETSSKLKKIGARRICSLCLYLRFESWGE